MNLKKITRHISRVFFILVGLIGCYVGYVYFSYQRLPDNQNLKVEQKATEETVKQQQSYRLVTFNIGYGSYPPDYTFFMDGGKESKARNKKSVKTNIHGVSETVKELNPDFIFFQEVDEKATRSRGVNEVKLLNQAFTNYSTSYGINYNSAYLMYPIFDPIGQSRSGLVTMSNVKIQQSTRYQLPIETTLNKFFDLDRAFTVQEIAVYGGKKLMLYNVHLSAYMKDQKKQQEQVRTLFNHMDNEYKKGNYVICGGDFNHDLLDNSSDYFHNRSKESFSWLQPFPKQMLPKHFQIASFKKQQKIEPSVRNLDKPYKKGDSFVALIDGFIVSDTIDVKSLEVFNQSFRYSDHHPALLEFSLK